MTFKPQLNQKQKGIKFSCELTYKIQNLSKLKYTKLLMKK